MRYFKAEVKKALIDEIFDQLRTVPWRALKTLEAYDNWLLNLVKKDCWPQLSKNNIERDRWGMLAKLLNIVIYEALWCRELASEEDWRRIHPWLHVPLDDHVINYLHQLDASSFPQFWNLTGVSEDYYMHVQTAARALATNLHRPAIWFEDAWSLHD